MGRISNYTRDTSLQNNDKLLGSNSTGQTVNFQVSDITKFLRQTNAAGIGNQAVYGYDAEGPLTNGRFTIDFGEAAKTFANLASMKISNFPNGATEAAVEYLSSLLDKDIVICDVDNVNNFGVYTMTSITQDSNAPNYYDLVLAYKSGNGTLVDEQFYSILLYSGSGDKTFTHTQSSAASSWTINHNLGKKPSVTVTTAATGAQVIGEVTYTNNNSLVVSFEASFNGIAHLN